MVRYLRAECSKAGRKQEIVDGQLMGSRIFLHPEEVGRFDDPEVVLGIAAWARTGGYAPYGALFAACLPGSSAILNRECRDDGVE